MSNKAKIYKYNEKTRTHGFFPEHEMGHMFSDGTLIQMSETGKSPATLKNWSSLGLIETFVNFADQKQYYNPLQIEEAEQLNKSERTSKTAEVVEFPEKGEVKLSDARKWANVSYPFASSLLDKGLVEEEFVLHDRKSRYVLAENWRAYIEANPPVRGRSANGVTLRVRIEDTELFNALIAMFENPSDALTALNKNMPKEFEDIANQYGLIKESKPRVKVTSVEGEDQTDEDEDDIEDEDDF